MFKKIFWIVGGAILLVGGINFLISKTCDIHYLDDKNLSPDGVYFIRAQDTNCPLLDRYTTDIIITNVKKDFLTFLNTNYIESILILRGSNPSVKISWEDNRTVKVKYSECNGVYRKKKEWKDIKIIFEGKCSDK